MSWRIFLVADFPIQMSDHKNYANFFLLRRHHSMLQKDECFSDIHFMDCFVANTEILSKVTKNMPKIPKMKNPKKARF